MPECVLLDMFRGESFSDIFQYLLDNRFHFFNLTFLLNPNYNMINYNSFRERFLFWELQLIILMT